MTTTRSAEGTARPTKVTSTAVETTKKVVAKAPAAIKQAQERLRTLKNPDAVWNAAPRIATRELAKYPALRNDKGFVALVNDLGAKKNLVAYLQNPPNPIPKEQSEWLQKNGYLPVAAGLTRARGELAAAEGKVKAAASKASQPLGDFVTLYGSGSNPQAVIDSFKKLSPENQQAALKMISDRGAASKDPTHQKWFSALSDIKTSQDAARSGAIDQARLEPAARHTAVSNADGVLHALRSQAGGSAATGTTGQATLTLKQAAREVIAANQALNVARSSGTPAQRAAAETRYQKAAGEFERIASSYQQTFGKSGRPGESIVTTLERNLGTARAERQAVFNALASYGEKVPVVGEGLKLVGIIGKATDHVLDFASGAQDGKATIAAIAREFSDGYIDKLKVPGTCSTAPPTSLLRAGPCSSRGGMTTFPTKRRWDWCWTPRAEGCWLGRHPVRRAQT